MRKHVNHLKSAFLLLTMLGLAACGGGGGGDPITNASNAATNAGTAATTDAMTPAAITSFTLTDANGGTVTSISSQQSATVTFTVTNSAGAVVANAAGNFEFDVPVASTKSGGSISSGSEKVVASGPFTADTSGQVSFALAITDPTVGGTGVLTLSFTTADSNIVTLTQNVEVVQVAGVPVSYSIALLQNEADASSTITSISAIAPGTLVATVVDFNNDPVVGEILTVSTTLGMLTPTSGSILTDNTGRATADIAVGTAQAGEAGTITVMVNNLAAQTVNFDIADTGTDSSSGINLVGGLYNSQVDITTADPSASPDPQAANRVSSVNSVESGIFLIIARDANGAPIPDAIISITSTVGALTPSNGQILTDSRGVATATIASGTNDPGAAGTITATLQDVMATQNFSIGSVTLILGFDTTADANTLVDDPNVEVGRIGVGSPGVTDGSTMLSATGTTPLSVTVANTDGTPFTTAPLTVNFTSSCANNNDATLDTNQTTVDGIATSTYEATGCSGMDTITASVAELAGVTATATLTVDDAAANSIQFISATPSVIALQGTGGTGRQEFSTLVFQVIDQAGMAISGQTVTVQLSTLLGGINLTGDSNDDGALSLPSEILTTNANGQVSVIVNAGAVPTSVRVTASIDLDGNAATTNDIVTTVSDSLAITTGLPDNNSFSLSGSVLSPGGFDFDGFISSQNLSAADAFNNPVPDGTTINFLTEYGRVISSCTTAGGNCSANWNSQSPRSPDFSSTGFVPSLQNTNCDQDLDGTADVGVPNGTPCGPTAVTAPALLTAELAQITGSTTTTVLRSPTSNSAAYPGQVFGGRTTILAHAIGEESFIDANGNGMYDWVELSVPPNSDYNAGVDSLEQFVDLAEAFVDHNEDGVFGNSTASGACTGPGVGRNIVSVVDNNDMDNDGNTTEMLGQAELCADWQVGGAEEEFIDFDADGIYDRGNGIYNGTLCNSILAGLSPPLCTNDLVSVRDSLVLNAGGSTPFIGIYDNTNTFVGPVAVDVTGGSVARRIFISDVFNSRLPGGTTIAITNDNCQLSGLASMTIADSNGFGNHLASISLSEDTGASSATGTVTITVTVPASAGAVSVVESFTCNDLN